MPSQNNFKGSRSPSLGLWSSWKSKDYPSRSNSLKTWAAYNHRKQCPIKRDSLEELQPIIEKFITHRLLGPCQSPCNIPILPVLKPTGDHRLVQDVRLVNKAVVPLHCLGANAYIILKYWTIRSGIQFQT